MMAYSKNPSLLLEKRQEFELNALTNKIVSLLTVPDSIRIEIPSAKQMVNFSIVAMEQILINLLSNAIRYNDKQRGWIKIRFAEDVEFYHLEIEDNGMGIPKAYLEKIFTNNFTLNLADRFNNKGSGIGLATVKDLLYLLNSTIIVESSIGLGSIFKVRLKK
jgi:signal transduction histidine kinase